LPSARQQGLFSICLVAYKLNPSYSVHSSWFITYSDYAWWFKWGAPIQAGANPDVMQSFGCIMCIKWPVLLFVKKTQETRIILWTNLNGKKTTNYLVVPAASLNSNSRYLISVQSFDGIHRARSILGAKIFSVPFACSCNKLTTMFVYIRLLVNYHCLWQLFVHLLASLSSYNVSCCHCFFLVSSLVSLHTRISAFVNRVSWHVSFRNMKNNH